MAHVDLDGLWHESSFRLVETYDVEVEPGWRIALDLQPYGEVFRVVTGRCRVELGEEQEVLEPGDVAVLLPGPGRLTADAGPDPLRFRGFGFRMELFGAIELSGLLGVPLRLREPWAELADGVAQTVRWGAEAGPVAALRARACAELTVATLTERCGDPRPPTGSVRREIAEAITLMEQHAGTDLDLGTVAASVHLSTKHFARLFKSVVGVPPMTYLQALRVSRARAALASDDRPVAAVAGDHGFADAAHFSRAFRQVYGCTPTEFRTRARSVVGGHPTASTGAAGSRPDELARVSMGRPATPRAGAHP